ncbi:hypothetical protein BDA96_08G126400 [Sorghum bicolor]|uniref:AT3G52170-like helix-turn-helix domain-containing protein n=2 Tax=Sorghum bicolor TaxID=4558 RepID=C5YP85_SORBI|nr:uncharacterized protein LOC8064620 isoform X2 [Sorghum bicolor]EES17110.1 hypothetical protein SORBI_3008G113300 [Sorghum bicolor]KAG0521038.1 hypothetical protein BDA96_08G126400 [Sorghum bicolor]|eukprot:XP_002443272.1 uncharacterized protein LOC8064620 isoform X2 [Sorghum bicolor]
MQAAAGSVSWVTAQPSVLGRCGGAPSASLKGSACGVGGGGCRIRGRDVAVPRCCARAQEKRPPRVRKSKEERREMVESFINGYRLSNEGKFPSVNLTHKEVGGSYYIVREIVRDIIQENRVLGPGGLDAMALSFEDRDDSSESSMKHELGQDNIEILDTSGSEVSKGYVPEISSTDESIPLQDNAISTQTLLGSSNILEAGVLNSVVQNGSAADAILMETNLEKQDEVPSGGSIEFDLNSSEEQARLFAQVSDSDEDIVLNSQADAQDGTASSATDGVILPLESSAVYESNAALLRDHETLPNDNHDGSTDGAVDDANLLAAINGVQAKQASLHEHDASTGSVSIDNAQSFDSQYSTTVSTDPINGSKSEAEVATKTVEASKVHRLQDEFEQPLVDASCDGQENSDSPVSHPALDTKGLLHTEDQHSVVQIDESEFKISTPGITKEEVQAADFRHEQGINTRTAISRHALCLLTLRCMLTVYNFLHTSQKAAVY